MGDTDRGEGRLGGEIPWLAHRKGMGDEVNRRTAADRLSCLHDTVPDCDGASAAAVYPMELAVGMSAAGILRGDDFHRRLFVVCVESVLRDKEFPERENLVAQNMVGAGAGFILGIAGDYRSFVIFRTKRDLKR